MYELTIDRFGRKYVGLTVNHDVPRSTIEILMPKYVAQMLKRFEFITPRRQIDSPIEHMRNALDALGHTQSASTIVVDNLCARGIAHREVTQRRTKSILLRYHWVRDRVDLGHLVVTWAPAEFNFADPLTKPVPGYKLKAVRSRYLSDHRPV